MKLLKKLKEKRIKRLLKKIKPDVGKKLIELGLLKIENNKKVYAFGSVHTVRIIQKHILKEKYNIDLEVPESGKITVD